MNIDEMEAGREMDALIAERVMGEAAPELPDADMSLNLFLAGSPITSPEGNWLCVHEFEEGDEPKWVAMSFSTHIAAAWRVVKKMREWDMAARLKFGKELQRLAEVRRGRDSILIHLTDILIFMEPEDICRAALKAQEALKGSALAPSVAKDTPASTAG